MNALDYLLTAQWLLCVNFLVGALFGMLDTETDTRLRSDIHDTVNSMLQTLAANNLTHWLGLCRDVLSASKSSTGGKGGLTLNRETEGGFFFKIKIKTKLRIMACFNNRL